MKKLSEFVNEAERSVEANETRNALRAITGALRVIEKLAQPKPYVVPQTTAPTAPAPTEPAPTAPIETTSTEA
jgi:hypothetical protein